MINEIDFTYCPNCATKFDKESDQLLVCPDCNLHYYVNPKPTNAVLLKNKEGRYLFVIRAHDPHKGKFDLPGGFIDINETVEESLTREIQEELGVEVTELSYLTSFTDEYEHGGVSSRSLCVLFKADLPENAKIKPADDVADYTFFSPDKVPYEDMAFAGMREAVRNLLRS